MKRYYCIVTNVQTKKKHCAHKEDAGMRISADIGNTNDYFSCVYFSTKNTHKLSNSVSVGGTYNMKPKNRSSFLNCEHLLNFQMLALLTSIHFKQFCRGLFYSLMTWKYLLKYFKLLFKSFQHFYFKSITCYFAHFKCDRFYELSFCYHSEISLLEISKIETYSFKTSKIETDSRVLNGL